MSIFHELFGELDYAYICRNTHKNVCKPRCKHMQYIQTYVAHICIQIHTYRNIQLYKGTLKSSWKDGIEGVCVSHELLKFFWVYTSVQTHTHTLHFLSLSRVTWTAWDKVTGKSHGHKWVVSASQADCPHPSLGNSDLPLSSLYVFHKCGITGFPEGPHGQPLLGTW